MMNKKPLRQARGLWAALLMCLLTALSGTADVTVRVVKGDYAPYLYAWVVEADESITELNGTWETHGQMTQTVTVDGVDYYTQTLPRDTVNVILTRERTVSSQTANITGLTGSNVYIYDCQASYNIYFTNPDGWDKPRAHIWNSRSNNSYKSWGTNDENMTQVSGNVYRYAFNWNEVPDRVIFYNSTNDNWKTNEFTYQDGNLFNSAGEYSAYEVDNSDNLFAFSETLPNDGHKYYVYLKKPADWDVPRVHVWDSGNSGNPYREWESNEEKMTQVEGDVYRYTFDWNQTPDRIIFHYKDNNNTNYQTGDLTFENGAFYVASGTNTVNKAATYKDGSRFTSDAGFGAAAQAAIGENVAFIPSMIQELDLSGSNLTSLKTDIKEFTGLLRLDVSRETEADGLQDNTQIDLTANTLLEYLNLANNHTKYFDCSTLANLKHLDLSGGDVYFNTKQSSYLLNTLTPANNPKLEYLDLHNSAMGTNTAAVPAFTRLKYLDVSDNPNLGTSFKVGAATNLETLKLNGCTSIDDATSIGTSRLNIAALTHLKHVEFAGTTTNQLDLGTAALMTALAGSRGTLEYLDISYARVATPSLSNFTALKTLKLDRTTTNTSLTVTGCPALETIDVTDNTALATINLSGNSFDQTRFPTIEGVEDVSANLDLNLGSNNFTTFPTANDLWNKVKTLRMRNNPFTGSLTLSGHSNLQCIDLTQSPDNTAITSLDLSDNGLTGAMLGGLAGLKALDLSGNSLTTTAGNNSEANLTGGAGRVYLTQSTALEEIDLSENRLLTASTYNNFDLTRCTGLKVVRASDNIAMTYWPAANGLPESVEELYLDGCSGLYAGTQITELTAAGIDDNLKILDLTATGISASTVDLENFAQLETLRIGNNPAMSNALTINNCPAFKTLVLDGDVALPRLAITNCVLNASKGVSISGLAACKALTEIDLSGNLYTAVPNLGTLNAATTSLYLNSNKLESISLPQGSTIEFLYAQSQDSQAFGGDYTLGSVGSLKGLDLGNNGFTGFKAEGTNLSALKIGGNTAMTKLELHGNDNLTRTTKSTTMSDGSGLYLIGNTALEEIDLSNSSFAVIGADGSFDLNGNNRAATALPGTNPVKKLNVSHNNLTTLTNSNYNVGGSSGNTESWRPANGVQAHQSSVEDLTSLEYLDVSYNQIADSVHLFRNTELKHLDVSHNLQLGPLAETQAEKDAMREKKIRAILKAAGKFYTATSATATPSLTTHTKGLSASDTEYQRSQWANAQATGGRPYDLRDCDLRDSTGIFHLDLHYNTKLTYLDFSYTNIHQTAAKRGPLNPGWGRNANDTWYTTTTSGTTSPQFPNTKHNMIWMQMCSELDTIKADYCNMHSFGSNNYPNLKYLSVKGRYGDSYLMRDGTLTSLTTTDGRTVTKTRGEVNMGNMSLSATTRKLKTPYRESWETDDGLSAAAYDTGYPQLLETLDVSGSGFYMLNLSNGVNLKKVYCNDNCLGEGRLAAPVVVDSTKVTGLVELHAARNPGLQTVKASGLPALEVLDITGDAAMKNLYVQNNPLLPQVTGLGALTAIEVLHAYRDAATADALLAGAFGDGGSANLANKTALKDLRVYNMSSLSDLDISNNTALERLEFQNCKVSGISNNGADLTALKYIDCSNTAKPASASEAGKNKLTDLEFASASLNTVLAGNNNLYSVKGTNVATLATIDVHGNHLNAIDLSNAPSTLVKNTSDNGRTVTANYQVSRHQQGEQVEMFFFSLTGDDFGAKVLGNEQAEDELNGTQRPSLAQDGFVAANFKTDGTFTGAVYYQAAAQGNAPRRIKTATSGSDLDDTYLNGEAFVILTPTSNDSDEGSGTMTYQYDDGTSTPSEFYLGWSASKDTPTGVDDVAADVPIVNERYYDVSGIEHSEPVKGVNIVVRTYSDGTTTSTKELR